MPPPPFPPPQRGVEVSQRAELGFGGRLSRAISGNRAEARMGTLAGVWS